MEFFWKTQKNNKKMDDVNRTTKVANKERGNSACKGQVPRTLRESCIPGARYWYIAYCVWLLLSQSRDQDRNKDDSDNHQDQ